MQALNDAFKKALSKLTEAVVDGETREWPPKCTYIFYQPQRPCARIEANEAEGSGKA